MGGGRNHFGPLDGAAVAGCVALAALLLAVRLPAAAQEARRSACQASLAQLAMSMKAYTMDFDDYLPQSINYSYANTTTYPDKTGKIGQIPQAWLVNGGYADLGTMRDGCPEFPADEKKFWGVAGYAYSAYLGRYDKNNEPDANPDIWYKNFPSMRLGAVKEPAKKFIMGDTRNNVFWLAYIGTSRTNDWRHDNGANYLYFDGHVQHHRKDEFAFTEKNWDGYSREEIPARLWPQ